MAASGHKTMEVFKRHNSVSKVELKQLVKANPLDMDTKQKKGLTKNG
jgi:hypothetical protein